LALLSLILASCGIVKTQGRIERSLAQASPGQPINMDDWCADSWTRVLIIPPYTARDTVEEALRWEWPGYADTHQEITDTHTLVVCVAESSILSWESVALGVADWDSPDIGVVAKGASTIKIELRDGRRYLIVAP
jgi:hypothetical protein